MDEKQENFPNNTAELQSKIANQSTEIAHLKHQLERMTELLLNAQRAKFGQSSEKVTYVMPGQDSFFDEAESTQNTKAPEPTEEVTEVAGHKRKAKRPWSEIMKNLPVEELVIELPGGQLTCEKCGGTFKLIGRKFVRQEIIFIPQSLKLLKYFSCTYACDRCEKETGYAHIATTVAPKPLMKHSLASPSTVADVMTKKYVDGLPLYRQEKIWQREGVELSRATLSNWVIQCAQSWLKPLYRHMKETLLTSEVIYADETVVQVLKEDGKPATSESRMWVYGCDERGGVPIRIFEYQKDRSGKHAEKFLNHFSGCLVTDGYAGYNKVADVMRCGCWAHMRRKWREAMPKGATMANSKAAIGYNYCNKLFSFEKKFKEMSSTIRKTARQVKAEPLLDEYFVWLKTLDATHGSKLAEAITYAKNQEGYLRAFLNHGEVEISNNFAENAIRPFAVGRKNWLFCDSMKGADSSAIVYTMTETAKVNGRNPYQYLLWVLSSMPYLDKNTSAEKLEALMPWNMTGM